MSVRTEVEVREGGIAVVHCSGRITLGVGSSALRSAIQELLASQRNKIVIDFAEVPYIDSSGFGELVRGFGEATKDGGGLVVARPTQRVNEVMRHTRLYTVFQSFESVEDAVQHFRGARTGSLPIR